jgi:CRP-like cAMP-binding protein
LIENLKYLLRHIVEYNESDFTDLEGAFIPNKIRKGEILLAPGEICKEFYFVNNGCLRVFFLDRSGKEKTRLILPDCSIGTSLSSFISQSPSLECIEALENTEVMTINRKRFYLLMDSSQNWNRFYVRILEMAYSFQNKKIEDLVVLSAKQRYEKLFAENPALIQKVSNKVLASYLNIREETLSRLKSR